MKGVIKITKEEIIKIYNDEYLKGDSTIVIGKRYNIHYSTLRREFLKLNLKLRSNKENSRKYFCNDNIFHVIDTPEKAYWIGFLSADGYVFNRNGKEKKVGLSLSVKDLEHLEKFKKFISATYPIHKYVSSGFSKSEYYRIVISSDSIYDDLLKNGVVEHKTNILKPPDTIPKCLMKYYLLGYFDGDGSIYLSKGRSPFYSISIVGTDAICKFVNDLLIENNIIDTPKKIEKRKKEQTVSYIRFGGNRIVSKILGFLYDGIDSDTPLKRKRELYLKCVNRIFD